MGGYNMKDLNKKIANGMIELTEKIAKNSVNKGCTFIFHQPVEPKELKEMKK